MSGTQLEQQLRNSVALLGDGNEKREKRMGSELAVRESAPVQMRQLFAIGTFEEAMRVATTLCKTEFVPEAYRGKPEATLAAIMMGAEIGLGPLQALQGIAMINGKPSVWGDTALALCQRHPDFIDCIETQDRATRTATCTITRRGREPVTRTYSWEEAENAGLTKKPTYQQHARRMLQMRARSYCMRDTFADALRGLAVIEEVVDYDGSNVTILHDVPVHNMVGAQVVPTLPPAAAAPPPPPPVAAPATPPPVAVLPTSDKPEDYVIREGKNKGKTLGQLAAQTGEGEPGYRTIEWYATACKDLPTKAAAKQLFDKMKAARAPRLVTNEVIDKDGVVHNTNAEAS